MRAELQVQIVHAALKTLRDMDEIDQEDLAEITKCLSIAMKKETDQDKKERSSVLLQARLAERSNAQVKKKVLQTQADADKMYRWLNHEWSVGDEIIIIRRT